jgi:hypothetical protein
MDLARAIATGEKVEKELDILITRRHDKREDEESDFPSEEMYEQSSPRYADQQREENRVAWCTHFERMRTLHWGLADEYEQKLKRLEESA